MDDSAQSGLICRIISTIKNYNKKAHKEYYQIPMFYWVKLLDKCYC